MDNDKIDLSKKGRMIYVNHKKYKFKFGNGF